MGNFIRRNLETRLRFSLLEDSVIYLTGPKGAGKKSLYLSLKEQFPYLNLEDEGKLAAAKENPAAFIQSLPPKTIIDHATLAPEIFKPMGIFVNKLRLANNGYVAGQFLLSGISKIDAVPSLPKNLTGQVRVLTLLPFAAAEIVGNGNINFIYDLFIKKPHNRQFKNIYNIDDIIAKATFAEIATSKVTETKAWHKKYIDQLLKDIKTLHNIEDQKDLNNMMTYLSTKMNEILDVEKLAEELSITKETCLKYLTILQDFYFLILVPAWNKKQNYKIYMMDTSLALSLSRPKQDSIFKNFIVSELTKHIEYLDKYPYKLFYSNSDGFIIQNIKDATFVAIDLKYDTNVTEEDFKHLKEIKKAEANFVKGVVLYLGQDIISFGEGLFAKPLSTLWGGS